jgi:pilus assembly protein CpaC
MNARIRGCGEAAVTTQQQSLPRKLKMRLPATISALAAGLLAMGVAVCLMPGTALAESAGPSAQVEAISVDVGTQQLLRQRLPIRRVALADPTIADVSVVNRGELLINGKTVGVTSLMLWSQDSKAPVKTYRVEVNARSISGSTPDLLSHRDAVLAAGSATSSTGSGGGNQAQTVADHTTVAVGTQVLSQVKIVDVERTALQEFGFNFFAANHAGTTGGIGSTGSITGATSSSTGGSITSQLPISSAFNVVYASSSYLAALSILETKGLARTLAEPSLTAMSGQTASFLAGGEFPFPSVQNGGTGGNNSITVEFKEFGIRLNLTPTVLAANRIAIKVAPEVSDLDYTNGITISGVTVPGLDVRRTDTMVELGDGETFVLSGLVSDTWKNSVSMVPGIGNIPVIGALFKNTSISRDQRELIMVVTPHLVRPLNRDAPQPDLPGNQMDHYNANFAHTMFMETGDFGYSH